MSTLLSNSVDEDGFRGTILQKVDLCERLVSHLMSDDKRHHIFIPRAQIQKRSYGRKSTRTISINNILQRVFCKKFVPSGDGASTSKLRSGRTKNTNVESCRISDAETSFIVTS